MDDRGSCRHQRADELGALRVGARGDLVVLSRDPLRTPPDALAQIRVERTVIGGRTVFSAEFEHRQQKEG